VKARQRGSRSKTDSNFDPKYLKRRYLNTKEPGSYSGVSGFVKNSNYKSKQKVLDTLAELKTVT